MKTYEDTIKYLNSFLNYEQLGFEEKVDFNLDKLKSALKKLGDPHKTFRVIHVAGTKGKGSVCTYTSSILRKAGYDTGLFISPHFFSVTERIQINGVPIAESDLTEIFCFLKNSLGDKINREFTYFEILTLAAIVFFDMRNVSFGVFETGMGGRLDATNILNSRVCAITSISYDHTKFLGETIEEIAAEKSGIIHEDAKCISLAQKTGAIETIKDRCDKMNADLFIIGEDIKYEIKDSDIDGTKFNVSGLYGKYDNCKTRMSGIFQAENASAGVGLYELSVGEEKVNRDAVKKGIRDAFIPGRMEIISRNPIIVIDGAQNAGSASALKDSVEQIFEYDKLILIAGLSKDKDIKGFCDELLPIADEVIMSRSSNPRAMDPHVLRGYVKGKKVYATKDIKEALGVALSRAKKTDLILVAGSFFLAAEVRALVLGKQ